MEKELYILILKLIPIVTFLLYLSIPYKKHGIKPIGSTPILFMVLIYILMIGFMPIPYGTDRENYVDTYMHLESYSDYKDPGWIILLRIIKSFFGNTYMALFVCTTTIYCILYYLFAINIFDRKYKAYFLILSFGSLNFINYASNILRGGVSIALCLYAISINNKWKKVLIFLIAISIQKFCILFVGAYIVSSYIKKDRLYELYWILCFILSASGIIDLANIAEVLGITDERAIHYMKGNNYANYKTGFRIDFVIYSIFPVLIAYYFFVKKDIKDNFHMMIYRMYLTANASWLLVIRIPFTDRVAYYSWVLIPILVLYPIVKYPSYYKCPRTLMNCIIIFYLSINIIL